MLIEKIFRRHIVLACCEKGHLVTLYTTLFVVRLEVNDFLEGANIQTTTRRMKRHNLDKNKNAAALKCDGDLRNASSLPFASQHRLQDN
jgi:hypothetical protein